MQSRSGRDTELIEQALDAAFDVVTDRRRWPWMRRRSRSPDGRAAFDEDGVVPDAVELGDVFADADGAVAGGVV
jgi:hypothetical protein